MNSVLHWNLPLVSVTGLLGLGFFGLILVLRFRLVRRLGSGRVRWVSEGFTALGLCLLFLSLLQPEIHMERTVTEKPTLGLLIDQTDSMNTQDVGTSSNVLSRAQWVQTFLDSQTFRDLEQTFRFATVEINHDGDARKQTDLSTGLRKLAAAGGLSAVLCLTDGSHNADDSPLAAAITLQQQGTPVYAISPGQTSRLPDLVVHPLNLPSYALAHEPQSIPVRLSSSLTDDVYAQLEMRINGKVVERKRVELASGQERQEVFQWVPRQEGTVNVDFVLQEHPDEKFSSNNIQSASLEVRDAVLNVLLIDGQPRWEFRYLRNALIRDPGVRVHSLLFHPELGIGSGDNYLPAFPPTMEELSVYDVIFLGDVGPGPNGLTKEQLDMIDALVKVQGSGLVFLPGRSGGHIKLLETGLQDVLPVEYDPTAPTGYGFDQEMQMWLSSAGRKHLLTQLHTSPAKNHAIWKQLPGFHWYAPVLRSRLGSEVLATHGSRRNEYGRIPLLVVREVGAGKSLFLGVDSAWRWRWGLEDVYHYRFWGQVVRWMAHKRHMFDAAQARVFLQPERPQLDQETELYVNLTSVMTASGLRSSGLRIRFTHEDGEVTEPALRSQTSDQMSWRGTWVPRRPGTYRMEVLGSQKESLLSTELAIHPEDREIQGQPVGLRLLRELARIKGGDAATHDGADRILSAIEAIPHRDREFQRLRLWQSPLWIACLLISFVLGWILRKRQGWI